MRRLLGTLATFVAGLTIGAALFYSPGRFAPVEAQSVDSPPGRGYRLPVKVLRIIDGDTARVEISHGGAISSIRTVRILGIDAAEMNTAEGKRHRDVATAFAAGKDGWLVMDADRADSFGRLLCDLEIGGKRWSTELREAGAKEYVRTGQTDPHSRRKVMEGWGWGKFGKNS